MKTLLTILLVLVMAAEAVAWYQTRKLISSWEDEVRERNIALTDEQLRYMEVREKLLRVAGATALLLFLLRFVVLDLFPV